MNTSLSTPDIDSVLTVLRHADDRSFLAQAHVLLLDRPIDASELHWRGRQLAHGASRLQIAQELARQAHFPTHHAAAEFLNRERYLATAADPAGAADRLLTLSGIDFVQQAYMLLLGRPADTGGLLHHLANLDAGCPKLEFLMQIHRSPEGLAYCAAQPDVLSTVQLLCDQATVSPGSMAQLLELPAQTFPYGAYRWILGREPDPSGFAHLHARLEGGYSRVGIVKALYHSPEARARGFTNPGVERAVSRFDKANAASWYGWYLRQVRRVESDAPQERAARAELAALLRRSRFRETEK